MATVTKYYVSQGGVWIGRDGALSELLPFDSLTADPSEDSVLLNWSPSDEPVTVARDGTVVASDLAAPSFTDTELSPETTYNYTVSSASRKSTVSATTLTAAESAWVRPPDWLPITITAGQQAFQVLVHVPTSGGSAGWENITGAYTVDWGDGSAPQNYASGVYASHQYVFDSLPDNAVSTGERQALVTITPQSGSTLTEWTGVGNGTMVELVNAAPTLTLWGAYSSSEANGIVRHYHTLTPITISSCLYQFDTQDFLEAISGHFVCDSNNLRMFQGCVRLTHISEMDCSSFDVYRDLFSDCNSLEYNLMYGFTMSVNLSGTSMGAVALNTFFTNLGTAIDASQTVDITGTPGAATCDRSIATAKGWTVNG